MSVIHCLVLDGWHRGSMHTIPFPGQYLRLMKPLSHTLCDCDPEFLSSIGRGPEVLEYKLAAKSEDGKMALYSRLGDLLRPMETGRDWIVDDPMRAPRPQAIRYNCQEERAW